MRRHRGLMARLCLLADRRRRSHDGLHNAGTDRTIAWSAECWRSAPGQHGAKRSVGYCFGPRETQRNNIYCLGTAERRYRTPLTNNSAVAEKMRDDHNHY